MIRIPWHPQRAPKALGADESPPPGALQIPAGSSPPLRHRLILIKPFLHIYNTFAHGCDLELSCIPTTHRKQGVSALWDNVDLGAGAITHMGYFISFLGIPIQKLPHKEGRRC